MVRDLDAGRVDLLAVEPSAFRSVLPLLWGWIGKAAESSKGKWTVEDIVTRLVEERAQLWAMYDTETGHYVGITVTHFFTDGSRKVCEILFVAGTGYLRWRGLLPKIEEFAVANKAKAIRYIRLQRAPKRGAEYPMIARIYEKDLPE